MLNAIIESSLNNRFFVLMATLLVAGLGVYSALHLPIDAVPDLTNVQVQVITEAPALSPLEVDSLLVVSGLGGDERAARRRADPVGLQVRRFGGDDRFQGRDRHLPGAAVGRRAAAARGRGDPAGLRHSDARARSPRPWARCFSSR